MDEIAIRFQIVIFFIIAKHPILEKSFNTMIRFATLKRLKQWSMTELKAEDINFRVFRFQTAIETEKAGDTIQII